MFARIAAKINLQKLIGAINDIVVFFKAVIRRNLLDIIKKLISMMYNTSFIVRGVQCFIANGNNSGIAII